MFLREAPTMTVEDLFKSYDSGTEALSLLGSEIVVDFEGPSDVVRIKDREIPGSLDTMLVLADWLDIPTSFLKRADRDVKAYLLNTLAQRKPEPIVVRVTTESEVVRSVTSPMEKVIDPRQVIEVAARVIGLDAMVDHIERDVMSIGFDTIVADNAKYGLGGDKAKKDITKGGLRWHLTNKGGLAPSVQRFFYRLACTNGMEMFDPGLKVDARGGTVESVLEELEAVAQRAFASIEGDIAHFYELRNRPVDNPERALQRMAVEAKLSERLRHRIVDRVPSLLDVEVHGSDGVSISEFDLVNLVTNTANDPTLTRRGAVVTLQRFGGSMVKTQVERCMTCASKLSA